MSLNSYTGNSDVLGEQYRTVQEIVERQLTLDIVSGEFPLGSHLSERELTERYNVSRGPVREVLKTLETQGLLVRTRSKGVRVATLSVAEMRELYEMRMELEGLAVRTAVQAATADDLARLETAFGRLDGARTDESGWLDENNAFHCALYETARRPRLLATIKQLMIQVEPYTRLYLSDHDHVQRSIEEHLPIWHAFRAGDAELCESLTREHLGSAGEAMERIVAQQDRLEAHVEA